MTAITRVSQNEMQRRTGFKGALGYAFPQEDEILIRKGLDKKTEKKVLAHEEEHIRKGEEGPFLNFIIPAVASVAGAALSSRSAKKATKAQTAAANQEIEFARESRDLARADQEPYRKAGATALDALMSMTGLAGTGAPVQAPRQIPRRFQGFAADEIRSIGAPRRSGYQLHARASGGPMYGRALGGGMVPNRSGPYGMKGPDYMVNEVGPENVFSGGAVTRNSQPSVIEGRTGYVQPNENPGGVEGGYNFMTDPGYEFRREEGMRGLERGAAARGGLLSGGFGRKAIRYGQDYASQEYTNVYNRIANIAGLGPVAAGASGNAAMIAGQKMGGAASNMGAARASGYTAQGNAWSTAANEIAKLPWGDIFKKKEGEG